MVAAVFGLKSTNMKNHWRKVAKLLPPFLERKLYKKYFKNQHTL